MLLVYRDESFKIIGACLEVHKTLGCGFHEFVYQEALAIEFKLRGIPFDREKELKVSYKGNILNRRYIPDFICFGQIIVELKALSELHSNNEAQVLNYLKVTDFKLGLLVNFGAEKLVYKRLVN